jgi:hypothetical protein
MGPEIFAVKAVEFEQGTMDPFGFDKQAEDLAQKYIPFSGTIRKPIYLVFNKYVKSLIKDGTLKLKSREHKDAELRLEKLLVYSWKRRYEGLRSRHVIGNSIRHINPFEGHGGTWVVQDSYKIYNGSAELLATDDLIEAYRKKNPDEPDVLRQFLQRSGSLERNQRFMEELLKKLGKKRLSLFRGELLLAPLFRRKMLKKIRETLYENEFSEDYSLCKRLLTKPKIAPKILNKVLINEVYPFHSRNLWYSAFILAVNADIEGSGTPLRWKKADGLYAKIKSHRPAHARPRPKCWFQLNGNDRYSTLKDFDKDGWRAIVAKAERQSEGFPFYSFRIFALQSLLAELDPHAY